MKNTTYNIGEKIREERLKHNMTQAKLSGEFISRNMLSLIESGQALPSLQTLEYIANVLDIPAGYFLTDDESTKALYDKIDCVSKAKALYKEKDYKKCADVCRSLPFDDEMNALLAECELEIAAGEMERFHLSSADAHLSSALTIGERTLYLGDDFKGTVEACKFFIECASGSIDVDVLGKTARKKNRIPPGFFGFLAILAGLDRSKISDPLAVCDFFPFLTREQYQYLRAKNYIMNFKYSKALEILLKLTESTKLGFITKYRILADIEGCYENKRDFENAYKYSSEKHRMLEAFSN